MKQVKDLALKALLILFLFTGVYAIASGVMELISNYEPIARL